MRRRDGQQDTFCGQDSVPDGQRRKKRRWEVGLKPSFGLAPTRAPSRDRKDEPGGVHSGHAETPKILPSGSAIKPMPELPEVERARKLCEKLIKSTVAKAWIGAAPNRLRRAGCAMRLLLMEACSRRLVVQNRASIRSSLSNIRKHSALPALRSCRAGSLVRQCLQQTAGGSNLP